MPYFSMKVFQVVITCLTTLGVYSTLPDVKSWLKLQPLFPFKDVLINLDRQTLELFVFAIFLIMILVKLYIVIIVWYCYRFMITTESFRTQAFFNMRSERGNNSNNNSRNSGYNPGINDDPESSNNRYKVDNESLLGLPPKYEDIIKESKIEDTNVRETPLGSIVINGAASRVLNLTASNQPTTSTNVAFKQVIIDESDSTMSDIDTNNTSKSLVNKSTSAESNSTIGPPSYCLAVQNKNSILNV